MVTVARRDPPSKSSKKSQTTKTPTTKASKKAAAKSKPKREAGAELLQEAKPKKLKPSRTLVPLRGSGKIVMPGDVPDESRLQQWPVATAPGQFRNLFGWDVESMSAALREHVMGNFRSSGVLLDDMKVNPIIKHCISVRQEAFRTLPKRIVKGKGEDAERFADFWKEVMPDILPDGTMDDMWLHQEFMGESVVAMDWEERTDGKDRWWLPLLKPWHPSQLYHYYNPEKGERNPDGQILAAITRERGPLVVDGGGGRWIHVTNGTLAPWLNATIRTLGESYLGDIYTLRDNLALQERFGQGVLKFFHPIEWADTQVQQSIVSVQGSGRGGVVGLPMTADGKRRADLELVNANAAGAALFDLTERRLMRRFLITLLGQDMTTVGQTGGYAQAAIHAGVLWDKKQRDAATWGDARLQHFIGDDGKPKRMWIPYSGPLRQQLTRWIAWFNYGSFDAAPFTFWDATPPEDALEKDKNESLVGQQRAAALQALMTAAMGKEGSLSTLSDVFEGLDLKARDIQFIALQCGIKLLAPPPTKEEIEQAQKDSEKA